VARRYTRGRFYAEWDTQASITREANPMTPPLLWHV